MDGELLVVGGAPAALSVALEASRGGLDSIRVVVPDDDEVPSGWPPRHRFAVIHTGPVRRIGTRPGGGVVVESDTDSFPASTCVLDTTGRLGTGEMPWEVPASISKNVHTSIDFDARNRDVLVIGGGEAAVVAVWTAAEMAARPVMCFTGDLGELSLAGRQILEHLEASQAATVLWHATPDGVVDMGGYPMATFPDRRTPDLQFDHVVVVHEGRRSLDEIAIDASEEDGLFIIGASPDHGGLAPREVWRTVRERRFPHLEYVEARDTVTMDGTESRRLRAANYNATITSFDTAHNELWRLRVKPDHAGVAHRAGQYCTLGLGYWEPRPDDAIDAKIEGKREKMIRRSYSISSRMFDDHAYLIDHAAEDEIELYIVWVRAEGDMVPALTPRLALKRPGDRVYLGPKVAGRYTLDPVTDPESPVVFCSTGTGEAPHNAMVVELLRKGHMGPILSMVSVRYWSDLAYTAEHRRLEERYPNYRYLPYPTRESDVPKKYMQDLLEDGTLEEDLGASLSGMTHVFLCGNPSMIGLPEWDEDVPSFPQPVGMAELLADRGLVLDRRGVVGNVHFEEYW